MAKFAILAVSASLLSGGALVALTGEAGPGAGGRDSGLDTDGDGVFDWLVVRMPLKVDEPNHYNVWASLGTRTPFGRGCFAIGPQPLDPSMPFRGGYPYPGPYEDPEVLYPISWASVRQFFEAGDHEVSLAFKGTDLGYAAVDGPYVVQAQVFADGQWSSDPRMGPGILPQPNGWSWTYTTGAYRASEFEAPRFAIRFAGTSEDRGLDTDGDALFDYLVLEAAADVALAGSYYYDASLLRAQDAGSDWPQWVTSTFGTVEFEEGRQTLEARFNGAEIWASGHSGTFDVVLNVYYGGNWFGNGTFREGEWPVPDAPDFDIYGDSLCGKTAEYRHEQWEELVEPASYTGVFHDYGEDLDADGLFDALVVEAEVEVTESNLFDFSGQLMSHDGSSWISGAYEQMYLDVGIHMLAVRFPGPDIRRSGIDGPYRVDLNLVVAMRDPATTVYTAPYLHTEFTEGDGNGTRGSLWIADLSADVEKGEAEDPYLTLRMAVTIERGPDLSAVVMHGIVAVDVSRSDGTTVFSGSGNVTLGSGGSAQSVSFSTALEPGTYVIRTTLESPWGNDRAEITLTF